MTKKTPCKHDVSIGICCYNEEETIAALLNNLIKKQDLTSSSEVIVVCSGCSDNTPQIVEEFSRKDKRIRLIEEHKRQGKASAVNIILNEAGNDFIVWIDADHIPLENSLNHLLGHFSDPQIGIVSGYHIPINKREGLMGKIGYTNMSLHNFSRQYCFENSINQQYGDVFWAMRREICTHIPKDIVGDDAYIGVECEQKGFKMYLEEKAVAFFWTPQTINDYVTQRRRFTYGNLLIKRKTGKRVEVLETLPTRHKLTILSRWLAGNMRAIPYLTVIILIETCTGFLARLDLKRKNRSISWKMAQSTKRSFSKK